MYWKKRRIEKSGLDEIIVTDTIPLSEEASKLKKIKIISLDKTIAEAINRVNKEESVSAMFLWGDKWQIKRY